jgi:hypothetical protein
MRYRLLLPFLLITVVLPAQMDDIPARLQWGEEQRAPGGSVLSKVIAAGPWGTTALRYRRGGLFSPERFLLEQYNDRYQLLERYELDLPEGADLEDILSLNGQLFWLISRPDEARQVSRVYVRPLSSTGQVIQEEQVVAEVALRDKFRRRMFDLEFNRDSSYLLLYNQLPTRRDDNEQFTLRVFDDRFQLLWSRDVSLPYRDRSFDILEYRLDQGGNVYVLGRLGSETGARDAAPVYRYILFAYTRDGRDEQEYRIELGEGRSIRRLTFRPAGNGDLVFTGFVRAPDRGPLEEACFFRIDPLYKTTTNLAFVPFVGALGDNTDQPLDPLEPVSFRPREMILRSDGGAVLIAEQYFRRDRMVPTYQGIRADTYFSYLDIVVINIAPDGSLEWARRIPKRQTTANDQGFYSSFALATVRDRFYFVYNDNPRNFSPQRGRQYNLDARASVITLSELTRAGELTTVPLFVNRDAQIVTRPRICRQIGSRLMLIFGEEGRRYRFGALEFE